MVGLARSRCAALVACGLAWAAAPARADVTVEKGGALRGGAAAALADAERAMNVCWRGTPPATVRVALAIADGGAVTASAASGEPAAQCAAGVLAVWTVPGGAWKGEVEIRSRVGAGDLAGAISRQLAARGDTIRACQAAAPSAAGPLVIRMQVHPEGQLTDIAVTSKLGPKLNACVEKAVASMRLDPLAADDPVAYQLSLTFSGARVAPAGPAGPPALTAVVESDDSVAGGSVTGALGGGDVQKVVKPALPRLAACLHGAASLELRFTVRADGTSKNVVVKDATGAAADATCFKKALAAIKFPPAGDETRVVLPITVR
ncbi:MAG TPA: hypothetical protein VHE35_04100 [Kofleriaceae bacterium]|nr:hypothetical protein [Kofleriaceae bacterium]